MPIYEYQCLTCSLQFTLFKRLSDTEPVTCSKCDSRNIKRLISRTSVVVSGRDRVRDVSWIDKDIAGRIKSKASGKLGPGLREAVGRLEGK